MRDAQIALFQYAPHRDPDGPDPELTDFLLWREESETADNEEEQEGTDFGWLGKS